MVERLKSGHKVIAIWKWRSAADAQHFIAELVGCYQAAAQSACRRHADSEFVLL